MLKPGDLVRSSVIDGIGIVLKEEDSSTNKYLVLVKGVAQEFWAGWLKKI